MSLTLPLRGDCAHTFLWPIGKISLKTKDFTMLLVCSGSVCFTSNTFKNADADHPSSYLLNILSVPIRNRFLFETVVILLSCCICVL